MLVFDRELLKYKRIRDHLDGKVIFVWFLVFVFNLYKISVKNLFNEFKMV